jgi:hypothetical protein
MGLHLLAHCGSAVSQIVFSQQKITVHHSNLPQDACAPFSLVDATGKVIASGIQSEQEATQIARDIWAIATRVMRIGVALTLVVPRCDGNASAP